MKAIIVAVDEENGIGKNGNLPWHYSEDLKFFSKTTKNAQCIMGRKTYEEILNIMKRKDGVSLLPNRLCYVVSSDESFKAEKAVTCRSFEQAWFMTTYKTDVVDRDVFVIGGSTMYELALPKIDTAFITSVPGTHDCDTFFNGMDYIQEHFELVDETISEKSNLKFTKYRRK